MLNFPAKDSMSDDCSTSNLLFASLSQPSVTHNASSRRFEPVHYDSTLLAITPGVDQRFFMLYMNNTVCVFVLYGQTTQREQITSSSDYTNSLPTRLTSSPTLKLAV